VFCVVRTESVAEVSSSFRW